MKSDAGKKALKISVPAIAILIVLKLISMALGGITGNSGDDSSSQEFFVSGTESAAVIQSETYSEDESTDYTEESADFSENEEVTVVDVPDEDPVITEVSDDVIVTEYSGYTEYRFRNKSLLNNHYEKHGIEMGFESAEEYEKAASDVVNSPDALYKKEKEDNDDIYYIEETNEFVVVSTDGYLRTYFLPDKGKAYFDRQ